MIAYFGCLPELTPVEWGDMAYESGQEFSVEYC